MKSVILYSVIGLVILGLNLVSCAKKEETEPEKGKIEQMTDEAAEVIVKKIRTPMDRARSVKKMEIDRARGIDQTLEEE